jgi:predicted ATP-binding protein involved in virulence
MKLRKIHIGNYKIFKDFDLDLTNDGEIQNLIVIAGINGSGKTTILKDIFLRFFVEHKIENSCNIEIEYYNINTKKKINLGFNSTNITQAVDKIIPGNLNSEFPKTYFFQAGQINQKNAKEIILNFVDKLIYQQDKKSSEAYEMVQKLLQELFMDFELQIQFKGISQSREIFFQNSSNKQISIDELSSGEQELITKSFSLYLADIKDSVILVDEPEGSMHPNWQSRIASIYQKLANENNNQIILATHSPHIVSSVNKEQIRVLVKENDTVRAIHDFTGSYGWRIDKVLLEIFRMTSLRTPIVEKEIQELKQMVLKEQFKSKDFDLKLKKLEKILGYDDLDLTMLRFEKLSREKQNEKN